MEHEPGHDRGACPHCGVLNARGNVVCHGCSRRLCETNPFVVNDGPEVYWEELKTGGVYEAWTAKLSGGSMLEWRYQDLLLTIVGFTIVSVTLFCYLALIFSGIA